MKFTYLNFKKEIFRFKENSVDACIILLQHGIATSLANMNTVYLVFLLHLHWLYRTKTFSKLRRIAKSFFGTQKVQIISQLTSIKTKNLVFFLTNLKLRVIFKSPLPTSFFYKASCNVFRLLKIL